MKPFPGVLLAGGTAATVLAVGLVFVIDVRQPAPSDGPTATQGPDETDLSLEARRQARLTESQAMLGGGRPAPPEPEPPPPAPAAPEPAPAPAPEPPPAAAPAPVVEPAAPAVPRKKARTPGRQAPARQATPAPTAAVPSPSADGGVVAVPAPGQPCTVATSGTSPVAEACRQGGVPEAKRTMKRLVGEAKARGANLTCETCHVDLDTYALRENAKSDFASLLTAAK